MDRDPQLKLELDYCVPRGIPHSGFRSWSVDDRDKALSWVVHQLEACPSCTTRPAEWNPKLGGHRQAYIAEIRGCEGCIVLARAEKDPALKEVPGRRAVLTRNPQLRRRPGLWRGQ